MLHGPGDAEAYRTVTTPQACDSGAAYSDTFASRVFSCYTVIRKGCGVNSREPALRISAAVQPGFAHMLRRPQERDSGVQRGWLMGRSYENPENLWVLEACSEETRRRFLEQGRVLCCPKGRVCIRAREENPDIFFILGGKVQIYNLTKCGQKKILFILGRNGIANESLVGSFNTIFCETIEDCAFFVIPREALLALMEKDFGLTRALFAYQERKLWRLGHQLKNTVGSIYLERKLASKLWKLGRDFGVDTEKGRMIDMDLSVTFLADLLGVPRETASRTCRKLIGFGLIRMERKRIYIPDSRKMALFYRKGSVD